MYNSRLSAAAEAAAPEVPKAYPEAKAVVTGEYLPLS